MSHGLNTEDLSHWLVKWSPTGLSIPVIGMDGKRQFDIHRYFGGKRRYSYDPPHCRPGVALYGLNRAFKSILQEDLVVVVEGFSDVIAFHKAGVTNTVGMLTSTLTATQAALLLTLTDRILLVFDGDVTGKTAALEVLRDSEKLNLRKFMSISIEGHDPATYYATKGADATKHLVSATSELMDTGIQYCTIKDDEVQEGIVDSV